MNPIPQLPPGAAQFLARLAAEPILAPSDIAETWVAAIAGAGSFVVERDDDAPSLEPLGDGIVRLKIHGVMMKRPGAFERMFLGATDTEALLGAVHEAKTAGVRGLVLDVDSPGGLVVGGPELANAIYGLPQKMPVVAWTGRYMASLAYWAGSQAQVVMASPSAIVGSIGVIVTIRDFSRMLEAFGVRTEVITNREAIYKGMGVFGTSLSDAQRAHIQGSVQDVYADFQSAIARRRTVEASAMQGQVTYGTRAVEARLIDQTGDFASAVALIKAELARQGRLG